MRSPDQEQRIVMGLFNRFCIRCHGVDGRGVWDIPDVPDFTDVRWQNSRSDHQIVNILMEGRGAVMPTFRGTLTLEESCAMARYLRTFVPGTAVERPDVGRAPAQNRTPQAPATGVPATSSIRTVTPPR
jgi:mono/diheme cytochrome c family protein